MCQLTLYKFHEDFDINKEEIKKDFLNLLYLTSVVNARDHGHGHGLTLYDKKSKRHLVIKSKKSGIVGTAVENLQLEEVVIGSHVAFHVRKVSAKYSKDEILKENAHPFEGENFILMHNGTVGGKHVTAEKNKTIIDSRIFHRELEKNWKEKKEKEGIPEVIQKTINDFSGKMAYIIVQKSTGKVFVLRNKRADLHKFPILYKKKVVGYGINTELYPIYSINNLAYRFTNFTFDLAKEAPKMIEDSVIFEAKEKDLETVSKFSMYETNYGYTYTTRNSRNHTRKALKSISEVDLSWIIEDFLYATKLSVPELNLLSTIFGIPIPYIKNTDQFVLLEDKLKDFFQRYFRKQKRIVMDEIVKEGVTIEDFHKYYSFPYFILSTKELEQIKQEIVNG